MLMADAGWQSQVGAMRVARGMEFVYFQAEAQPRTGVAVALGWEGVMDVGRLTMQVRDVLLGLDIHAGWLLDPHPTEFVVMVNPGDLERVGTERLGSKLRESIPGTKIWATERKEVVTVNGVDHPLVLLSVFG